jgi:hypothetical protein
MMGTRKDTDVVVTADVETGKDLTAPGDFNVDSLRLSQNFTEMVGVKKKIITVPVKKPDKQWFVRLIFP